MADLWWLMLGLGVAVFVVFAVALAAALFRRPEQADAGSPADEESENAALTARWIVPGGVVMPLVVLIVVFGLTLAAMRAIPDEGGPDALAIEVIGHQWWWEIHYPDEGITTANEIHIPVGRPVELRLTSADVIHSFWVPALGGKLDLLPSRTTALVLEADEPGEYRGQCAEFCGLQHANMGLVAVAETPERFEAWLSRRQDGASESAGASAQRGQQVFLQSCARCHTVQGTAARGTDGPDLTHFASRRTLAAATLTNTPEHLADWIADPQRIKPGTQMPPADLTDPQMEALLRYLETLE